MTAEPHHTEPVDEPRMETPLVVDRHQPSSVQRLVGWLVWQLVWHVQEIAITGIPAGFASVTGWWPLWIATGLAGAGWLGHELHQRRQMEG
jgi:hypothetical protein